MKEQNKSLSSNLSDQNNKTFNISMLTQTPQTPPQQSVFSPRNILNFFSKNIEEITSPRDIMNSIQNLGRENSHNKSLSPFLSHQIHKQFSVYLQGIDKNMSKYKSNIKKCTKAAITQNQRQQIENQVKLSKIPKQYFEQWSQQSDLHSQQKQKSQKQKQLQTRYNPIYVSSQIPEKIQPIQHLSSRKLELLMIPSAQSMFKSKNEKRKKPSKINLRQKQEELSQYLDQVQLIIFTKAKKYPQKYLCYLDNISSADSQIDHALKAVWSFRRINSIKLIKISEKYQHTKQLKIKQKNLQQTLKWIKYLKMIDIQKKKSLNHSLKNQMIDKNDFMDCFNLMTATNNKKLHELKSVERVLANLEQINKTIKYNRLMDMKKQLQQILSKIIVTYDREDWLRNQLPKHSIKPQLQIKAGVNRNQMENDGLNNSFLNISVLDQSYCMGSVKAGSLLSDLKPNVIKKIAGMQQKKENLRQNWQQYCRQYYGNKAEKSSDIYLQQQEQVLGELILKQLIKHNSSFSRDIEDYLTLVYSQKNLIQEAQTHQERLYYLQAKFYNKILTIYYDAVKNVINFTNYCFYELKGTRQKISNFIKERIQDFINIRKINAHTDFQEVVTIIFGSFDYWINDPSFLIFNTHMKSLIQKQVVNSQQIKYIEQWQQYIFHKKIKLIEEYINNLHENTLVKKIKAEIESDNFQPIGISSEYFLLLDYILNYGQTTEKDINSQTKINGQQCNGVDLEASLCFLGDIDNSSKPKFSIFKVIDKILVIQGTRYKIMKSFLLLLTQVEAYLRVKNFFPQLSKKIDEKICQSIGFYCWYCKKMIINKNNTEKRSFRALCMLKQICQLLNKILQILNMQTVPKKLDKLQKDMKSIITEVEKQIEMYPFLQVQQQISKLYQSRLKIRKQIPTSQSMRIIDVLEKCRSALEQFETVSLNSLLNTVKAICKNYVGYLLNMETRGKAELKWFIPKLRQCIGDLFHQQIATIQKKFLYQKKF